MTPDAAGFEVLDHTPVGAVVLRQDFTVVFWNRMLEAWTRRPRAEVLGRSLLELFPRLHDPRFKERLEDVFQEGPPAIFSSKLHGHFLEAPLAGGGLRRQQATVSALPVAEGAPRLAVAIVEDVTELTRSVDAYRAVRDRALAEVETRRAAQAELERSREELRAAAVGKEVLLDELREKVDRVSTLSGLIPICAHCKKIRDDRGYWERVESFISKAAGTAFSHGICPDCLEKHFPP